MHVTPHIVAKDAGAAAAWYVRAFGARECSRVPLPGGRVMAIELAIGDSILHVASEFPDAGVVSPLTVGGTASALQIKTEDADGLLGRAPWADHRPVRTPLECGSASSRCPTRGGSRGCG